MKMNSSRIICHALILIFILALSGCAKRMISATEVNDSQVNPSVIQEVKVSDDGMEVTISANKPLTYTSYKTSTPPKIFVDLAQTEPGLIKGIESERGIAKDIKISRQDFGSGFLSRIEINLRGDCDFSIKQDATDKGKLKINLVAPQAALQLNKPDDIANTKPVSTIEKMDETGPKAVDSASTKDDNNIAATETNSLKMDGKESASVATPVAIDDNPPPVSPPSLKTLTAVNVQNDIIELSIAGGAATFTSFKLDKPQRLVVDLFETQNATQTNSIAINKFGITKARIGSSPEKVRIVFDAAPELPKYNIEKVGNGLIISFPQVSDRAGKIETPTTEPQKPVAEKPVSPARGAVESIDFKIVDGYSQIQILTNGSCIPEKPLTTTKGVLVNLKNCELPEKLQRSIDTKAFPSSVVSVTPYQVRLAGTNNSRVLIKLRRKAAFSDRRDGNSYILEVKNPETLEEAHAVAKEKAAPTASKLEDELLVAPASGAESGNLPKSVVTRQQPKKVYSGRKVTLEFSDADIRKIFQLIAEVSNLNFLIADDVTGTISIKLVNVPWDQALDVILDTKNLGMIREGNIVQIKPKAKMQSLADEELAAKKVRERGMELKTEIFDVNYAAVADILTQFNTIKSERGVVSTDARTNRVIVKDISSAIDDMRALLKSLDTPEKQVMIEARIVEASTSFVRDLGVQWGIHYVDGSASVAGISRLDTGFGGQVATAPTSGTSGPGAAAGMSFGKLASNIQLEMRLSAAVTADQIKIMSTPRVVTLNNKPAKISQGASIPYQTTSAEGTKTEFVEAALTLEVTPHITADGSIGMKIKASNNSAGTGSPPPINKKEATTELLVKNGETTVIGGIYVDSDTESDRGVPFLQDIPLLGWLFKSNSKNKTKNELLIFITPKIVS